MLFDLGEGRFDIIDPELFQCARQIDLAFLDCDSDQRAQQAFADRVCGRFYGTLAPFGDYNTVLLDHQGLSLIHI